MTNRAKNGERVKLVSCCPIYHRIGLVERDFFEVAGRLELTMRGLVIACVAIAFALSSSAGAEFGTREEAVAMVKRVQEEFARSGAAATFTDVNDKSNAVFHDRDLYPFIYDLKGVNVAHGARPALVGKNLISLKDQNGTYLIQEMIAIAKGPGKGWVDYKWPNPINNKIEDKSSYIERMGDYFVGVGVYRFVPGHI